MSATTVAGGAASPSLAGQQAEQRYMAWFHELDAWTEYWDIYHPETHGRYNFGDGHQERGLLTRYLPRDGQPPAHVAWRAMALWGDGGAEGSRAERFAQEACAPAVAEAVMEIEELQARLFARHFGDAADPAVQDDYLRAMFRFGSNTLPPALERYERIAPDDPRKHSCGRHMVAGDIMWFAWALHLEAVEAVAGVRQDGRAGHGAGGHARRTLMLAGVAVGCPADFAWRGHRRTRQEYRPDEATEALLHERGLAWANDYEAARREVHALFRIREWGSED